MASEASKTPSSQKLPNVELYKPFPTFFSRFFEELNLPAPVKLNDLNKECRATHLVGETFEGLKVDFAKTLSENFTITHSLSLGERAAPSTYNFGAHYNGQKFSISSRMDKDGNLTARLIGQLSNNVLAHGMAQMSPDTQRVDSGSIEIDVHGNSSNAQIKMNRGDENLTTLTFMQSITEKLQLGLEGLYEHDRMFSALRFGARYQTPQYAATATYASYGMLSLSYTHAVSQKVSLASELNFNTRNRESVCGIGYKFDLRQACVRGMVDSTGKVSCLLEEKLAPGVSLNLSGEIDHSTKDARFGIGLTVGQ
eukprot:GCRY01002460.1.p1 GENE.GCRY01002460.1~~GCRY01002460.1.p1  ORF type:complete len:331 (-),score=47.03 GCRY01002460.1:558-1490(-)